MTSSKNTYLSNYQFVILFIGYLYGSTTIVAVGAKAKQDAWIAFLIALLFGLIVIYGYSLIAKLNPQKNLTEILIAHFGKYIGSLISILYIWYFLHLASLVFRNFGEFMLITILPKSSLFVIVSVFAITIAYAVRLGIETMSRVFGLLVPLIFFIAILISFILSSEYDISNILPVFANGFGPILSTSFSSLTFPFGESVVFLMIFPYLKEKKYISRAPLLGTIIIGLLIILIILRNLAILGPNLISTLTYPTNTIITLIPGYGMESLFNLSILIGGVVKTSILLFAACNATSQLFKINDYKFYVLSFAAFIVSLSIWVYPNVLEMTRWAGEVWPYYSIPFQFVVPSILLIMSFIRKGRQRTAKSY